MLTVLFILFSIKGYSCVSCNKNVQQAIGESIYKNHFEMFIAFVALAVAVLFLVRLTFINLKEISHNFDPDLSRIPLKCTAMILGMGLGGFADGIVLHQILQWHEMLSNTIGTSTLVSKSVNTFWDGVFHLFTLLTTLTGIFLLWRISRQVNINKSGNLLTGGLLTGWGIFNLIEGIINHQILRLHNVKELSSHTDWWNYGFLLFGISLIISGNITIRKTTNQ